MPIFRCEHCNYQTKRTQDYRRHLGTNKHIDNVCKLKINNNKFETHICQYCNKSFKYSQGLSKHIKYSCTKSKDEDLQELVRLLNLQRQEEIDSMKGELQAQNRLFHKKITKLSRKLKINVNHIENMNNHTFNKHINLLNYDNTCYKFLTETDYVRSIKDCNYCVKSFIEKVHFNDDHPENMNIFISSIKSNYIMVYRDQKWNVVDRKKHINDMYEDNEVQLESWYYEYKDKYPSIIESFKRYLNNREENEVINRVKKDILLMLYNERNKVKENYKRLIESQMLTPETYENMEYI